MDPAATRLCRSPRVKNAERWLRRLPLAEPESCFEKMLEALTCLNSVTLAPQSRLRIMEALRAPIDTLLPQWVGRCGTLSYPLPPRIRERVEQISVLLQTVCTGYLRAETAKRRLFVLRGRRLSALALQRYLHYANWLLFFHRLTGCPAPEGLWRQIHAAYQRAVEGRFANRVVDDPLKGYRKGSVAHAYHRLLLTALAPVHEFEHRWWEALLMAIGIWSRTLRLESGGDSERARYFVAIRSDAPPTPGHREAQGPGWYLDTVVLEKRLKHRLEQTRGREISVKLPEGEVTLPRAALKRFLDQWCQIPARHSARRPIMQSLPVVVGLGALHHVLSPEAGETLKTTPITSGSHPKPRNHAPEAGEWRATRDERRDVWASIYAPEHLIGDPATRRSKHWTEAVDKRDFYRTLTARAEDVSSGGACLSLPIEAVDNLGIGSLVGIQSPSGHWRAGVVCWFGESGTRLRFGIRNLAFRCAPATLIVLRDDKPVTRLPALAGRNRDQSPLIIVPSLPSLDDDSLQVQVGRKPQRVVLEAILFESERYLAVNVPNLELEEPAEELS